jgi:hypothetical protein
MARPRNRLVPTLAVAIACAAMIAGPPDHASIALAQGAGPRGAPGLSAIPPIGPAATIEEGEEPSSFTCAGGGRGGPPSVTLRFTAPAHHGHVDCSALYVGISLRGDEPSWVPVAEPVAPTASPSGDRRIVCQLRSSARSTIVVSSLDESSDAVNVCSQLRNGLRLPVAGNWDASGAPLVWLGPDRLGATANADGLWQLKRTLSALEDDLEVSVVAALPDGWREYHVACDSGVLVYWVQVSPDGSWALGRSDTRSNGGGPEIVARGALAGSLGEPLRVALSCTMTPEGLVHISAVIGDEEIGEWTDPKPPYSFATIVDAFWGVRIAGEAEPGSVIATELRMTRQLTEDPVPGAPPSPSAMPGGST